MTSVLHLAPHMKGPDVTVPAAGDAEDVLATVPGVRTPYPL